MTLSLQVEPLHLVVGPKQAAAREIHPGSPLMQLQGLARDGTGPGRPHSFSLMAIKLWGPFLSNSFPSYDVINLALKKGKHSKTWAFVSNMKQTGEGSCRN